MFTAGEKYRIVLRENGENTTYPECKLISAQLPLIKVKIDGEEKIFNTWSLSFVSADRING